MQPQPPFPIFPLPEPQLAFAASRPQPRLPVVPVAVAAGMAIVSSIAFSDMPDPVVRTAAWAAGLVISAGVVGLSLTWGYLAATRLRDESAMVERAEDAARLGRMDVATGTLGSLLTSTMISPANRGRALTAYVGAMARAGRYEEAVGSADALMKEGVPGDVAVRLRATKAYALLREDRLADADRAVSELRKMGRDGPVGAVLALVESYRDVRTGHGAELIAAYPERRELIARFMGLRVGDVDGLAAWAHLRSGDEVSAGACWRRATLLVGAAELVQRYPELEFVAGKLPVAAVPPEVLA